MFHLSPESSPESSPFIHETMGDKIFQGKSKIIVQRILGRGSKYHGGPNILLQATYKY